MRIPDARIAWRAERFRVFNRPDLQLVVDGNGSVAFEGGRLALTGSLKAEEGRFVYVSEAGATLGDDVVVKGWPRQAPPSLRAAQLPLALDLAVDLGERLYFSGEGLEARLEGTLQIANGPRGFSGKGTIRTVNGTYAAFGQRLTIDPGRLLFDGPLDNPGLDIVALRKNLAVEAGVAISGTVRVPIIALTSNPPVPDGEKLSWLLLGQGLARTSGADAAALQAASGMLLGRNTQSVTSRIAESVGLDDISIRGSSTAQRAGDARHHRRRAGGRTEQTAYRPAVADLRAGAVDRQQRVEAPVRADAQHLAAGGNGRHQRHRDPLQHLVRVSGPQAQIARTRAEMSTAWVDSLPGGSAPAGRAGATGHAHDSNSFATAPVMKRLRDA